MSDHKYPTRGCMSDDGKFYTHTDGGVHEVSEFTGCGDCSLDDYCDSQEECPCIGIKGGQTSFLKIDRAYVPSDEEREAIESMRLSVAECGYRNRLFRLCTEPEFTGSGCSVCAMLTDKTCPARAFLASKKHSDAWEVNP